MPRLKTAAPTIAPPRPPRTPPAPTIATIQSAPPAPLAPLAAPSLTHAAAPSTSSPPHSGGEDTPENSLPELEAAQLENWLEFLRKRAAAIRFGSIQIFIHNGKVIQIEQTEKFRLASNDAQKSVRKQLTHRIFNIETESH